VYEFIKTATGWLLFWGPAPVEVEAAVVVAEDEVPEGELVLAGDDVEWPAPMAV